MKKYIEPKSRCIEIDTEALIAQSPAGMQNDTPINDEFNDNDQLVKRQGGFDWSNEW